LLKCFLETVQFNKIIWEGKLAPKLLHGNLDNKRKLTEV